MFNAIYCTDILRNMARECRRHDESDMSTYIYKWITRLLRTEKGWKPEGAVDWTLTWGVRPWQMYRMGMLSESGPWSTHRSGLRLFLSYRHTRTHARTHTHKCNIWASRSDPFHTANPERRRWIKNAKTIYLSQSANDRCVWKRPGAQLSFVFTMELLIMLFHKRMAIRKSALLALHCDKWNSKPWVRKIILSSNCFYNSILRETMSFVR